MTAPRMLTIRNCQAVDVGELRCLGVHSFRDAVLGRIAEGFRLASLFGVPAHRIKSAENFTGGEVRLFAVLALDEEGLLTAFCTDVKGSFASLTPECPQAHWFEREVHEAWGVVPQGHPWLKPIRFTNRPVGVTEFFELEGAEVHEVAVGPVHAGIIEPGHFRFQCHGENVYHLEISLGYQHRGIENAVLAFPEKRRLHYMETLSGDTTLGHAVAYAQLSEALSGAALPPARGLALRGIALELERLANHTGDLGALAGDVGFLPTASYCGRIRGDFLNLTALLCGNRFGRGMAVPGGVAFDAEERRINEFVEKLGQAKRDVTGAVNLLWETPSVMARFENTGPLSRQACLDLGIVGPAARASGINRDIRCDFPTGIYRFANVPASTWNSGDVFSRALVRWLEIQRSLEFIQNQIHRLPEGPCRDPMPSNGKGLFAVSLVEGWRGEICHVAITDAEGRPACYKITDPSFHNWIGLSLSMRGQQISDFPLCNKSFNLSYCGHDL